MTSFLIEGGNRLSGEITPQGAKNEALEVICAAMLTKEEVRIKNIPDILDVNNLICLLRDMGVVVTKQGEGDFVFKAENIDLSYLDSREYLEKCASLRGSVLLIGPLLARFGRAVISRPGLSLIHI